MQKMRDGGKSPSWFFNSTLLNKEIKSYKNDFLIYIDKNIYLVYIFVISSTLYYQETESNYY